MSMVKADAIVSSRVREILPEDMQGIPYIRAEKGFIGTIVKVVYSTYPVAERDAMGKPLRDQDGNVIPRKTKDGSRIIYNTTAYVKWQEGGLSSFNGRTALNQLASLTGEYVKDATEVTVRECDPCRVKLITQRETFGNEEYDKIAFDPLD